MNSYILSDDRPRVSGLEQSEATEATDADWEFVRSAGVFLSELLLFYPRHRVVFLGRDMEYHHDVAQVLLRDLPEQARRLNLINISRAALLSPDWQRYAEQQLFCERVVDRDQPLVLVDSGLNGDVIKAIQAAFPGRIIDGHLLCSENPGFPLSHAALEPLGVDWSDDHFARRHRVESLIEYLPHVTAQASGYSRRGETWHALPAVAADVADGQEQARILMGSLRARADCWRGSWRDAHTCLQHLVDALVGVPVERLRLDIDARLLALTAPTARMEVERCLDLPFGFGDFVREIACRMRTGMVEVVLVCAAADTTRCRRLLDLLTYRGCSLSGLGFRAGTPDPVGALPFPTGDFHKAATAVLQWIDGQALTEQPPRWQDLVRTVRALPGGTGVIRDLLEEAPHKRLGIFLRPERIGRLWSLLLDSRDARPGSARVW